MEISKLTVDQRLIQGGNWVEYDEETRFKLASSSSKRYRETYQEGIEELRRIKRRISAEDAEALTIETFSKAIVVDWQGVTKDGQPFACNPENVKFILVNCPHVREFIFAAANNFENFHAEQLAEVKQKLGEA